ncbi:hypothetical protein K3165_00565 [Qipengyuania sp. 1XM1-15A]|uniref:hypothetical protein n=1 Tax=Qipengyuania xiamenensis TaxID=2867237 RepID=UPI001C876D72|nr:hypothetical protein [Qipengyuania xiamenensis]MBX7531408.1 hypothetical protein [Qipengyuania xiamenensis]
MPKTSTLTDSYAFFGAEIRNPRWSWSAVSKDGKTVVVTLWGDEIAADGSVDFFGHPKVDRWKTQIGNRFRIKDLIHARDHCDGEFRVVRLTAVDTKAIPRAIKQREPDPDVVMRLTRLDEQTGEFVAQPVK